MICGGEKTWTPKRKKCPPPRGLGGAKVRNHLLNVFTVEARNLQLIVHQFTQKPSSPSFIRWHCKVLHVLFDHSRAQLHWVPPSQPTLPANLRQGAPHHCPVVSGAQAGQHPHWVLGAAQQRFNKARVPTGQHRFRV